MPERWYTTAERHALAGLSRSELAATKRVFNGLAREQQLRLAERVARERRAELCATYASLATVGFGYRTRSDRSHGYRIVRKPCVTFIVKRKWRQPRPDSQQRLPPYLLTTIPDDGEDCLCAVPTDVVPAARFSGARLQAGDAVHVGGNLESRAFIGRLTCMVSRDREPGVRYALSCRHVLSMTEELHPRNPTSATVEARQGGRLIGHTSSVRGRLSTSGESLDAQLARIDDNVDLGQVAALIGGQQFDAVRPSALDWPDFPPLFYIHTARHALKVELVGFLERPFPYPQVGMVNNGMLAIARFRSEPTITGDSGSPVFTLPYGGTLLGMHLGGNSRHAFILPIWMALDPVKYGRRSERWQMLA